MSLAASTPIATVAVRDLDVAARFYEGVLGLARRSTEAGTAITYRAGEASLFVYVSDHAGTNRASAVTWDVGKELKTVVERLRAAGGRFEHYDMPGTRRDGDIHVGEGGPRMAWLADPDGNIHALMDAS